jgi:flagellar motor protein MotB
VAKKVQKTMSPTDRKNVQVEAKAGKLTLTLKSDDVLFARGSAELTPAAERTLTAVAKSLQGVPGRLRVEGHTCDLPMRGRYASNWELSSQRAINVVMYLMRHEGIPARRLSAIGYADTVPVVPNTSEANRAQNRRIEIVVEQGGIEGGNEGVSAKAEPNASAEIKPAAVDVKDQTMKDPAVGNEEEDVKP